MAKYYGKVGYALPREKKPGVIVYNEILERPYYGDVSRNVIKQEPGETLNSDLNVQVDISIIADEYAYAHAHLIKYATYMGTKWIVKSITPSRPRLTLSLGGVYHEQ